VSFPSRFNGKVHVVQRGKVRLLYLGHRLDIVHTRMHLDRPDALISPYQRCLLLGFGLFPEPLKEVRRVAMVGLGGGAITRFFQLKWPGLVFHSVEIDPVVVAVARRFFGVRDTATFRSYAQDGRAFLAKARRPYDVIIMDAFDASASLPRSLASAEFFQMLRDRLAPRGVLIMNFLVHSRRIYAALLRTLQTVFPAVRRIPLRRFQSYNTLLIAPRDPASLPKPALWRERLDRLQRVLATHFPLHRCLDAMDTDRVDVAHAEVFHDSPPARAARPREEANLPRPHIRPASTGRPRPGARLPARPMTGQ